MIAPPHLPSSPVCSGTECLSSLGVVIDCYGAGGEYSFSFDTLIQQRCLLTPFAIYQPIIHSNATYTLRHMEQFGSPPDHDQIDDNLGTTNATIQHYLAVTDLRPGILTSVPYSSLSQVTLHKALKGLSARSGYNTWTRIKDYLKSIHSEEGRRSSVLDVGTGTGVWAYELGDDEPFADVIGVE